MAGGVAILALDMYEHAYHRDLGAAAGAYIDTFMQNIDWLRLYERYRQCVTGIHDDLGATAERAGGARVIDVRSAAVFEQSDVVAEGAVWPHPAQVDTWAAQLPASEPVAVHCVYGHEVGRSTAMRLRAAGVDARFLIGGLDGWRSEGRLLASKPGC